MKESKRCTACHKVKPLDEFVKDRTCADGHRSDCLECHRVRARESWRKWQRINPTPSKADPKVTCLRDPTRMYSGNFDRRSFTGTLWDGNWPTDSEWLLAVPHTAKRTTWRLVGDTLYEVGSGRVVKALGTKYDPTLRVIDAATAAKD